MAIATTTVVIVAPKAATKAMASKIAGIAIRPSITRIKMASSVRKYPANMPNPPPSTKDNTAVQEPTNNDTRVP